MPFCISEVRHREFPSAGAVSSALTSVGSSLENVLDAFRGYICPVSPTAGRGFQEDLARDLEHYLERVLKGDGLTAFGARLLRHQDVGRAWLWLSRKRHPRILHNFTPP